MTSPLLIPQFVTTEACQALLEAARSAPPTQRSAPLLDALGNNDYTTRHSDEVALHPCHLAPFRDAVKAALPQCREHFKSQQLEILRPPRVLRYKEGDYIVQHRDAGTDRVDGRDAMRITSFSIQISHPEDFEGGELIVYGFHRIPGFERLGKTLHLGQGQAVFFESRMQHEVSRVTMGTRLSAIGHLGLWA